MQGGEAAGAKSYAAARKRGKANLETLAKGGGRHIVCMPITPDGEVEKEVMRRPGRFKKVPTTSRSRGSGR